MSKLQALMGWVDDRFPMTKMWEEHLSKYYGIRELTHGLHIPMTLLYAEKQLPTTYNG